ncbi:MAG: galactokinase [Treponema sp.]|nr:galactokinase [Treponema sp.]
MINSDLPEKINSKHAAEIFAELYGEDHIETARNRYNTLINEMFNGSFPETELVNTSGDLRIFSAPGRTELAGNHTDHNRGKVLAASIQLDSVAIVQKRNDNIVFFRSTGFPDVKVKLTDLHGAPDLLSKPEETGTTEALIRGIAAELNRRGCSIGGFSANAASIVLPGSGLSSSAAVEVLICRIFDSLYGEGNRTPLEIAQIGQYAENAYFGKPCGLMDQTACAAGGAVAIDFADPDNPIAEQINFDLTAAGYILCVVNTGGSHADLTADYASIPAEMKAVAGFFGKSVLRELDKETILNRAADIRKKLGDRALLRAIHFFDENARVDIMLNALKKEDINRFLVLVNESGNSSLELLQNVYSPNNPGSQGITTALTLTKDFFRRQKTTAQLACRVHGGGFAGTIQAYIPADTIDAYRTNMEAVFGLNSVTPLRIRPKGVIELVF